MLIQNWSPDLFFVNNMFSVHSRNSMDFTMLFPKDRDVLVTSTDVGTRVL